MSTLQKDIQKSVEVLKAGGVILYSTDTIWGLGCDATNESAVRKVFVVKRRPAGKSLIVLASGLDMLANYVDEVPQNIINIFEQFTGPLTVIYKGAKGLAQSVIADDGSVAIRIPKSGYALELVKAFGKPVVSTSANISGEPVARVFDEIKEEIICNVDFVSAIGRDLPPSEASRLIKLTADGYRVLR